MKYFFKTILFFLCIFFLKCNNTKEVPKKKKGKDMIEFYDLIFDELKGIDIDTYSIKYLINENYRIEKNIDVEFELKKTYENFSKEISMKNKEVINMSNKNNLNKEQIIYKFSLPYEIKTGEVLIFNRIKYKYPNSKSAKGGSKRLFYFKKKNKEWRINKVITLEDF